MTDEFHYHRTADGHVLVILHPACAISRDAILALLAEIGIDLAAVTFLQPDEVATCSVIDGTPVVIPVDQACSNAPELDTAGRQCGQAGGGVIVLFGEDFSYTGLHPIAEKYGNQCGWSPDQLDVCLREPVATVPRTSGGIPLQRPQSEQVKC